MVWNQDFPTWDTSGDVSQDGFLSHNRPFKQEPPFSSVGPHLVWCLSQSIKRGLQAWLSSVFRMMLRDIQVVWKYNRYLFHEKPLSRYLLLYSKRPRSIFHNSGVRRVDLTTALENSCSSVQWNRPRGTMLSRTRWVRGTCTYCICPEPTDPLRKTTFALVVWNRERCVASNKAKISGIS